MALDETKNKTPLKVWVKLRQLMDEHPDAKIVYDGWMELYAVEWNEKEQVIELVFD